MGMLSRPSRGARGARFHRRREGPHAAGPFVLRAALHAVATGLLLVLVWIAVGRGVTPLSLGISVGAAGFTAALVVLTPKRLGIALLAVAFFTAPFYKGLTLVGAVTLTDLCLVLGFTLLLPTLATNRLELSPLYLWSATAVLLIGTLSSVMSARPIESLVTLVQWGVCIVLLPVALVALGPSHRLIDRFAWAFVAGHVFDTVWAVGLTAPEDGRYAGLTPHSNYFAEAGMMSTALLLHLFRRTTNRWVWWASLVVSVSSVYLSGGRAATLVLAGLLVLIPIVERTAAAGYFTALGGAVGAVALGHLISVSDDSSSLGRLAGEGGATVSDRARGAGFDEGMERFWEAPFFGSGLIDLSVVHNNFLEVGIAIGILGLFAYCTMMLALLRPLFGHSEMRRLCYAVIAYIGFGLTTPSLTDRTIWMAVALSVVVFRGFPVEPAARRSAQSGLRVAESDR